MTGERRAERRAERRYSPLLLWQLLASSLRNENQLPWALDKIDKQQSNGDPKSGEVPTATRACLRCFKGDVRIFYFFDRRSKEKWKVRKSFDALTAMTYSSGSLTTFF
jgi:ribosomal protein L32